MLFQASIVVAIVLTIAAAQIQVPSPSETNPGQQIIRVGSTYYTPLYAVNNNFQVLEPAESAALGVVRNPVLDFSQLTGQRGYKYDPPKRGYTYPVPTTTTSTRPPPLAEQNPADEEDRYATERAPLTQPDRVAEYPVTEEPIGIETDQEIESVGITPEPPRPRPVNDRPSFELATAQECPDDTPDSWPCGYRTTIPGVEGVDYPIYTKVPKTSFRCIDYDHSGYFADVEARCQAFHVCLRRDSTPTKKYSFLCPNGTVFNQQEFACTWWNEAPECSYSPDYYNLNTQLNWDEITERNMMRLPLSRPTINSRTASPSQPTTPSRPTPLSQPTSFSRPTTQSRPTPLSQATTFSRPTTQSQATPLSRPAAQTRPTLPPIAVRLNQNIDPIGANLIEVQRSKAYVTGKANSKSQSLTKFERGFSDSEAYEDKSIPAEGFIVNRKPGGNRLSSQSDRFDGVSQTSQAPTRPPTTTTTTFQPRRTTTELPLPTEVEDYDYDFTQGSTNTIPPTTPAPTTSSRPTYGPPNFIPPEPTSPPLRTETPGISYNEDLTDTTLQDFFSSRNIGTTGVYQTTTVAVPSPTTPKPKLNYKASTPANFKSEDADTIDKILQSTNIADTIPNGVEFTGFGSLGTQSQLFNSNIRDLLKSKGKVQEVRPEFVEVVKEGSLNDVEPSTPASNSAADLRNKKPVDVREFESQISAQPNSAPASSEQENELPRESLYKEGGDGGVEKATSILPQQQSAGVISTSAPQAIPQFQPGFPQFFQPVFQVLQHPPPQFQQQQQPQFFQPQMRQLFAAPPYIPPVLISSQQPQPQAPPQQIPNQYLLPAPGQPQPAAGGQQSQPQYLVQNAQPQQQGQQLQQLPPQQQGQQQLPIQQPGQQQFPIQQPGQQQQLPQLQPPQRHGQQQLPPQEQGQQQLPQQQQPIPVPQYSQMLPVPQYQVISPQYTQIFPTAQPQMLQPYAPVPMQAYNPPAEETPAQESPEPDVSHHQDENEYSPPPSSSPPEYFSGSSSLDYTSGSSSPDYSSGSSSSGFESYPTQSSPSGPSFTSTSYYSPPQRPRNNGYFGPIRNLFKNAFSPSKSRPPQPTIFSSRPQYQSRPTYLPPQSQSSSGYSSSSSSFSSGSGGDFDQFIDQSVSRPVVVSPSTATPGAQERLEIVPSMGIHLKTIVSGNGGSGILSSALNAAAQQQSQKQETQETAESQNFRVTQPLQIYNPQNIPAARLEIFLPCQTGPNKVCANDGRSALVPQQTPVSQYKPTVPIKQPQHYAQPSAYRQPAVNYQKTAATFQQPAASFQHPQGWTKITPVPNGHGYKNSATLLQPVPTQITPVYQAAASQNHLQHSSSSHYDRTKALVAHKGQATHYNGSKLGPAPTHQQPATMLRHVASYTNNAASVPTPSHRGNIPVHSAATRQQQENQGSYGFKPNH